MVKDRVEILGLIPARQGSKSIPDKNLRTVGGKPLLAHSVEHSLASRLITRTIVSTDSAEYAEIARSCGAETPFLRPAEISGDTSTDLQTFIHTLDWLEKNEGYEPEICVHLRPTYPIRKIEDIDAVIRLLLANDEIDSVRTVVPAPVTPFKMWFRDDKGLLQPVVECEISEAYNLPRQVLPTVYLQNACIDAVRTSVILRQNSMTGKLIYGYPMEDDFDIDDDGDLEKAEAYFARKALTDSVEPKTFCVDIDGVIAAIQPNLNYTEAKPIRGNIDLINRLFEAGHRIILFTARGSATGRDWKEITRKQMNDWGVKHNEIAFHKPAADYYLDDKMISLAQIREFLKL